MTWMPSMRLLALALAARIRASDALIATQGARAMPLRHSVGCAIPMARPVAGRCVVFHSTSSNDEGDTKGERKAITSNDNQDFWTQQKELAREMTSQNSKSIRQVQLEKFEARRLALVYDTAQFAVYIFCGCWIFFENPFTAFSYAFGATMGLAYAFGLGKSVETLGQSIDDVIDGKGAGAGVGEARFAFLILLFIFVGKFRGELGLQEIPSIAGFFTYQIASLNQGLREIND